MLIVAGEFEVDPERREEFLRSRADSMRASRGERGCYEYVLSADPLQPGRVVLYERWEDEECLAAHLVSIRSQPPADAATAVPIISMDIQQYEISAFGTLGG